MSSEWPDEVRAVVRLLIDGGASPSVVPISGGGGWVVYVSNARVTYDSAGWWNGGERTNGSDALAHLARVAGKSDLRTALQERIHAAVPGALVTTTTDGIEVTVGSKSVRWKRERNGWSMDGDDYAGSDERVIEHAQRMAVEAEKRAEASAAAIALADRLRAKYPDAKIEATQERDEWCVVGERGTAGFHTIYAGGLWRWNGDQCNEDGIVEHISRWFDRNAPTAPRPLIDRLREAVPGLEWSADDHELRGRNSAGYSVIYVWHRLLCYERESEPHAVNIERPSDDQVVRIVTEWCAKTHAAPQPSPRAQALLDALRAQGYEPTYKRHPGSVHESVLCENEMANAYVDEPLWWYLGAQAGTEYVAEQMGLRIARRRERTLDTTAAMTAAADFGRGSDKTVVTVTINGNILDTDALTQAIEEHTKREKAHAAKGPTMTTQDPEQRRREEGVVMAELCREVLQKRPNAANSALIVESDRDWYYALVLSEHFDEVEAQYENGRFYLYQRNATTAPALTLELVRAALLSNAGIPADDDNTRTRTRRIPSKRAVVHDIERIAPYSQWIAERQKRNEGAPTMTTKTQALIQTAKLDASEAAWRTAGSQFVKLAREPLVGLLTRHLAPNDDAFRARLAAFLETELGTALLASMLSATLSALPQTTGEVPQKLARELRVKAMATAGDELASVLSGPLLSVMRLYLQDPQGAPAAPALDAPQSTGVEWATQGEKVAK